MPRRVFLSHSSIDAVAAKALKERMLATPAAREAGLSIWFDQDDLRIGEPWQPQLEAAVAASQVFAVYLGSRGVANWIAPELRLAISRSVAEPDYRVIPILAPGADRMGSSLPGFARQFQGVREVEHAPEQFERLMRAVLGSGDTGSVRLEAEPFFGLRAIDATRGHLFFGRDDETDDLVERLRRASLVLVTGDSGSGKSSLVLAGLVPRWRGGAVLAVSDARPTDGIWHTVAMRPRGDPLRELGDAVGEAAKGLGLPLAERDHLAERAAGGELDKVRRALRCDLPLAQARVLLIVDQFEELLTQTPLEQRGPFIDLLLGLCDPGDARVRVVLTMRQDYVNLLHEDADDPASPFRRLQQRLDADDRRARLRLGRMRDAGLRSIVTEPLRLAGVAQADRDALAKQVLRDVGERPGDLALVQMALTEAWHARRQHGDDLLVAYSQVGRVEGALAQAAEQVRTQVLTEPERALLGPVLLRLVRLGDTGGATRRVAARNEFGDDAWTLVQRLASPDGKRLVLVGGADAASSAEIAHEALVTAWPHFQNLLQANAEPKRVLDALIPRARGWADAQGDDARAKRLATGADLEQFVALAEQQGDWLSAVELAFVAESWDAEARRVRRERLMTRSLQSVAAVLLVAFGVAGWLGWRATIAERVAAEQAKTAVQNESRALSALSQVASREHRYDDAVKLALAAWPRSLDELRPRLARTLEALGEAQRSQRLILAPLWHDGPVRGAAFSHDETRILSWSEDMTARLWNVRSGEQLLTLPHSTRVAGPALNHDQTRMLSWSVGNSLTLWDTRNGEALLTLQHEGPINGGVFNHDGTRILSWSDNESQRPGRFGFINPSVGYLLHLWDGRSGESLLTLRHDRPVRGAAFNHDGTRIVSWSEEQIAHRSSEYCLLVPFRTWMLDHDLHLWDASSGRELLTLKHDAPVYNAKFNHDGTRILSRSHYNLRLWDARSGEALLTLRHDRPVSGAEFNQDGTRILSWSDDENVRVWDAHSGEALLTLTGLGRGQFSPDETRVLSWLDDGRLRLWDASTGEALLTLRHNEARGAGFSRDGTRILTWSRDGSLYLWDADTGAVLLTLWQEGPVDGAAFDHDGNRILSWSHDGSLRLWDARGSGALVTFPLEREPNGAAFNHDESGILSWSDDGSVRVWSAHTGEALLTLLHPGDVYGAVFNHEETRILSWSQGRGLRLWDARSGEALLTLRKEAETVSDNMIEKEPAAFNHDGSRILSWSDDRSIHVWNAQSGEALLTLEHEDWVWGAAWNCVETRILSWSADKTVRLWDAHSGVALLTLEHEDEVRGAAFSRDETRILSWSWEGTLRLWDARSGEVLVTLRHEAAVTGATFNHDDSRILSWSGDRSLRLWDATSGAVLLTLWHEGPVDGAAFNRDETRILSWSADGSVRLWDAFSGQALLRRRHENVEGATFNRDETQILSWSGDGTLRLWDASSGEALLTLEHGARVKGAAFSEDKARILSWSDDGTVRLWDISRLPKGHLIDVACALLPDHDTAGLEATYGVTIREPICVPGTPAPDRWTLDD